MIIIYYMIILQVKGTTHSFVPCNKRELTNCNFKYYFVYITHFTDICLSFQIINNEVNYILAR